MRTLALLTLLAAACDWQYYDGRPVSLTDPGVAESLTLEANVVPAYTDGTDTFAPITYVQLAFKSKPESSADCYRVDDAAGLTIDGSTGWFTLSGGAARSVKGRFLGCQTITSEDDGFLGGDIVVHEGATTWTLDAPVAPGERHVTLVDPADGAIVPGQRVTLAWSRPDDVLADAKVCYARHETCATDVRIDGTTITFTAPPWTSDSDKDGLDVSATVSIAPTTCTWPGGCAGSMAVGLPWAVDIHRAP